MSDPIDLAQFEGHTPGPWTWWDSCSFRRLSHLYDGDVLSPVVQYSDGHPDVYLKNGGYTGPDGRLIACAPRLLAELRTLRAADESRKRRDAAVDELIIAAEAFVGSAETVGEGDHERLIDALDALAAIKGEAK